MTIRYENKETKRQLEITVKPVHLFWILLVL